jgi:hypothetical protein
MFEPDWPAIFLVQPFLAIGEPAGFAAATFW